VNPRRALRSLPASGWPPLAAVVSVCLTTVLCAQLTAAETRGHGDSTRDRPAARGPDLLAVAPMCLFTAALQAAVATLARSFKEAQTYMGVLILGPMLPGVLSSLYPIGNATWTYAVPCSDRMSCTDVLGGRVPDATFLTSAGPAYWPARLIQIPRAVQSEHILWTVSPGFGGSSSGFASAGLPTLCTHLNARRTHRLPLPARSRENGGGSACVRTCRRSFLSRPRA
jgi:hypothetical protein